MRISFDLDGVITDGQAHEFFIEMEKEYPPSTWPLRTRCFYSSCKLLNTPHRLMDEGDKAVIITARHPDAQEVTRLWLCKHNIDLPIFFADFYGDIDWQNYVDGSKQAAYQKSLIMKLLRIEKHYDNNPHIVNMLQELIPELYCVLVESEGGEYHGAVPLVRPSFVT